MLCSSDRRTDGTACAGLFVPNGVAYANGSLWVTQNNVTTMYENADAAAIAGQVRSTLRPGS